MTTLLLAGEDLLLDARRAAVWPAARTLFIADLHLGKHAAYAALGAAVPQQAAQADLDALGRLIADHRAQRLVVLGDLVHARAGLTADVLAALAAWRVRHADLRITQVLGNHDLRAGPLPDELAIESLPESSSLVPFTLLHDPDAPEAPAPEIPALAGHVHPMVTLAPRHGRASLRARCFWLRRRTLILPAFGAFTGGGRIAPARGDRVFACGPNSVHEVTSALVGPPAPARTLR